MPGARSGDALYTPTAPMCHGTGGAADGPVSSFMSAPSLLTPTARAWSDGYLYSMIRYGRGIMPQVRRQDRPAATSAGRWSITCVSCRRRRRCRRHLPEGPSDDQRLRGDPRPAGRAGRSWYGGKSGEPKGLVEAATKWYLGRHLDSIFAGAGDAAPRDPELPPPPAPEAGSAGTAALLLARSERPVLVLGSGAMMSPADAAGLARAVAALSLPVFLSGTARGLLGTASPLQVRHRRKEALREADLVLLAGVPCDFRLDYGRQIGAFGHARLREPRPERPDSEPPPHPRRARRSGALPPRALRRQLRPAFPAPPGSDGSASATRRGMRRSPLRPRERRDRSTRSPSAGGSRRRSRRRASSSPTVAISSPRRPTSFARAARSRGSTRGFSERSASERGSRSARPSAARTRTSSSSGATARPATAWWKSTPS